MSTKWRSLTSLIPVSILLVERPGHAQQPWQDVYEDSPHPGSHDVCLRTPEVDVEHHHRHTDAEGVEDHGEEDELAQEGDHQGGGGDDLGQQEEEHSEGEEDGNGKADLTNDSIYHQLGTGQKKSTFSPLSDGR